MSKPSFKEVVTTWKAELPGRTVPIPNKGDPDTRIDAYMDLFEMAFANGYTKEDIFSPLNKGIIINASHNPHHKDVKKGNNWRDLATEDLETAKALHPAWSGEVKRVKFDKSKINFEAPEAKPYTPPPTPEPLPDPVIDTNNDNEVRLPTISRPFTKEEWDNIPDITPEYDPEMRKLLGFDDER